MGSVLRWGVFCFSVKRRVEGRTKRKGLRKRWERRDIARQMLSGRWTGSPVPKLGGV